MKRSLCKKCGYPLKTCVCSVVQHTPLPIRIIIFQHPKEVKHAKNTARLAKLVSPSIELINVADAKLMQETMEKLSRKNALVLFPSVNSSAIEFLSEARSDNDCLNNKITTLIFIDASWKQAYGLWQKHRILRECIQGHFANPPRGNYRIRKAAKSSQLSTIEAIAYTLNVMFNTDTLFYRSIFNKMQSSWDVHKRVK